MVIKTKSILNEFTLFVDKYYTIFFRLKVLNQSVYKSSKSFRRMYHSAVKRLKKINALNCFQGKFM